VNRASQIRMKRSLGTLTSSHRALSCAIEDALTHYWIALKTAGVGLPVAWDVVAQRMAEALEAVTEQQEGQRAGQA
jgi:hypothetical protein